MALTATIGLEIHAELNTRTKMFCDSKNDPDEDRPNVNVCPICMGHPGSLPTINSEAVRQVLRVGRAIGGTTADFTEFDRKNYFYPDIPKGYQLSQYKYPLVRGGSIGTVQVTRVHLEEDTARSTHDASDRSLVDFNRAGVPLMELVTEPVIHTGDEAISFARELQLLLRSIGAGEANMEKGEMRVEANISVGEEGALGTKVEVKNLNSFRAVGRAIDYEIKRQTKILESGKAVIQETRGWNEAKQETFPQRLKEESHDYRYFPDPDLPKLYIKGIFEFSDENLVKSLPELPWDRRSRYMNNLGMTHKEAEIFLSNEEFLSLLEERVLQAFKDSKEGVRLSINYIASDLAGLLAKGDQYSVQKAADGFVGLISMILEGEVSSRGAKDILEVLARDGGDPRRIAEERSLGQKSDRDELVAIVRRVIEDNGVVANEVRSGKVAPLQFLIGQVMKATKGAANPSLTSQILKEELGN